MLRHTALLLALCLLPVAPSQQLARPGWRGNSFTPEAWYRHTSLVRLPPDTTFAQAAASIDAVNAVGADGMILPDLTPGTRNQRPFADTFGSDEELDSLLRETSARRMHVLLQAPLARLAAHPDEVRFWMSHGIAGFDLGSITPADTGGLQQLRTVLDRFPGQRILLARQSGDIAYSTHAGPLAFRIVSEGAASSVSGSPQFVDVGSAAARSGKAADADLLRSFLPLLLAQGQPIFDSRIIATDAGRAALQQMLLIRNSHAGLRTSDAVSLQQDDIHAWLFKSNNARGQRPLVIVENTGSAPATLHLQQALKAAGARGTFLRPTLRTDGGMGAIDLESSTLPPGSFAIAELQ